MRKSRSGFSILVVLLMFGLLLFGESKHDAQASNGSYCGGESQDNVGLSLNLNLTCQDLYGGQAKAVSTKADAYGWVCRVPGQQDKGLDMQRACRRWYGNDAFAALVGIGASDWRCVLPASTPQGTGISGHVVPVLLFPVEKLNTNEAPFVTAALQRVETLMSGVRHFYRERTSALVRGTNAFVLPTSTSATEWQNLANTNRAGYHQRVLQELSNGPWSGNFGNNSVRIGGFVTLGSSPPTPLPVILPRRSFRRFDAPITLRFLENLFSLPEALAMGRSGFVPPPPQNAFSLLPYVSYAGCSPTTSNSAAFESAFFDVGNGLGTAFGLPRSDQYAFNDLLPMPPNVQQSIMYTGNGTKSVLFPFEACRLLPFLSNWR
jgi:hypothetical protein